MRLNRRWQTEIGKHIFKGFILSDQNRLKFPQYTLSDAYQTKIVQFIIEEL